MKSTTPETGSSLHQSLREAKINTRPARKAATVLHKLELINDGDYDEVCDNLALGVCGVCCNYMYEPGPLENKYFCSWQCIGTHYD